MSEIKNYNIFALRGDTEVSDAEVCESLGLNPNLANTPELNEAAIRKMHRENYDGYIKQGMSDTDALTKADNLSSNTRKEIRNLLSK